MTERPLRLTIWNEFVHEKRHDAVRQIYPDGIHRVLADSLENQFGSRAVVQTATLDQPEHGLTDEVLEQTDVLLWWGHAAHDQVADQIVERVHRRILDGMGFMPLHSAHLSKVFVRLMGTTCMLRWRDAGEKERLWVVDPSHPIVEGIEGEYFELPQTEMYGEHFDIPAPDELVLISWFEGGEVFRSGCTFRRGKGKIFYFRPGHETFPIYHDANVQRVIANGAKWVAPTGGFYAGDGRNIAEPIERLESDYQTDSKLHGTSD